MLRVSSEVKLDFSDVLIVPQRSDLSSRSEVDLMREYSFAHTDRKWKGIGIISANMGVTGTFEMSKVLAKHNCLTALHKFYSVEQLVSFYTENPSLLNNTFYTVGIGEVDYQKIKQVQRELDNDDFPYFLNIDVANGYMQCFIDAVEKYRKEFPKAIIMAGNVVTPNIAEELVLKGADIVKAGIGQGSACQTRIVAGIGFPQLSSVAECSFAVHGKPGGLVCADGGCANIGDISKAFCAGGDFVMLGGMFAGTDECEGEWIYKTKIDHSKNPPLVHTEQIRDKIKFYGMSSEYAQNKFNGGMNEYRASEGRVVYIKHKGSVEKVIQSILGGLRSTGSYIGAKRIKDFPKCAQFIRVNNTHNRIYEGKEIE